MLAKMAVWLVDWTLHTINFTIFQMMSFASANDPFTISELIISPKHRFQNNSNFYDAVFMLPKFFRNAIKSAFPIIIIIIISFHLYWTPFCNQTTNNDKNSRRKHSIRKQSNKKIKKMLSLAQMGVHKMGKSDHFSFRLHTLFILYAVYCV